jgi:hypothetical protein
LWAEQHSPSGGTAIVILPLSFTRASHPILASCAPCSRTPVAHACVE